MQKRVALRLAKVLSLLALVASCTSSGDVTPPETNNGDGSITLSLSVNSASLAPGSATATTVTIARSGGFSGDVGVTVENLPAGVTATAAPQSVAAGNNSTTVTISVQGSASPGTYTLTIRGTGTNATAGTATFTLTINQPATPDFSISATPSPLSIQAGATGNANIAITRIGGFAGEVFLTVSGAPSGVDLDIVPGSTTGNTATLTATVDVGAEPGTYTLTITGAATGIENRTAALSLVINPLPSLGTISLSSSSIQVTQGQQDVPVTVTINRGTGVTGSAQLSVENIPPTIGASFAPNPAAGNTSTLSLDVALAHGPGTITVRVRALIGTASATADLQITTSAFIPPDFAIAVNPDVGSVTAGSGTTAPVTITRTGGYDGDVTFNVTGAPAGVTAAVTPSPTSGNSATLDITTTGAAAPGAYPLTVTATGAGIVGARTDQFTLTVNAPAGGGQVHWKFCRANRLPIWFGVRSGTSGTFTRVQADVNQTFSFTFEQNGQVAYVQQAADGFNTFVFNVTPQEALQLAAGECMSNPAQKSVSGSLANIQANYAVSLAMGGANTIAPFGLTTYNFPAIDDRPTDLLALHGFFNAGSFEQFNRIILRRNLNPAGGANMPVLDFDPGATEWVPAASSNSFYDGFGSDPFVITMAYLTSNGMIGTYYTELTPSTTSPRSLPGLPQSAQAAGDLHRLFATTTSLTTPRQITQYSTVISPPGVKSFGPVLSAPTVTVQGTAPVRIRAVGTWQPEYNLASGATFLQAQAAPNQRSVTMTGSATFFGGGATFTFEVPDFTGSEGWNPDWMLRAGVNTMHTVSADGLQSGASTTPADGVVIRSAQRIGNITP